MQEASSKQHEAAAVVAVVVVVATSAVMFIRKETRLNATWEGGAVGAASSLGGSGSHDAC
jgi:hypothetical protein